MKNLMLIVGALMLFGLVAKAQPARVDKPTEWKPNTTVLVSANQQYRLFYKSDGNLVVYDKSNKTLWNSKTNGKKPNKLVFQADGNLVLYGANNAVHWAAYCHNKGGKSLRLNDQGSLSVWNDNDCIWKNGDEIKTNTLVVMNLHPVIQGDELRDIFSQFGEVSSAKVINDRESGRSTGFVEMMTKEDAARARENINGSFIGGKVIQVEFTDPRR